MDYILQSIEKKIKRFEGKAEAKIYYQVRIEYAYYLLLAYFWNKNFQEIGITDFILQSNIIKDIQRPSIGTIWDIVQKLDIEKELSKNKNNQTGNVYAELRNDKIGHGYSFEDDLQNYIGEFKEQYHYLTNLRIQLLSRKTDIIVVQNYDNSSNEYTGTIYDYEGDIRSNWRCPKQIYEFEINNVYASFEPNIYFRLSPFIHIEIEDDSLYVFRQVQQPLLGKIRYNRIDKSDKDYTKCWEEFEFAANNGIQKKHPNGCIINDFNPNYKKYIEIGSLKARVYDFLIGKEKSSSVCITLWGHGGNGKTATAQKICEELANNERRPFEFILFLSAKDRELNKYTGKISPINNENRVTTFDDLIEKINYLLYSEKSTDIIKVVQDKSRILFVIDDYETFEDIDKEQIKTFIKQLNLNYHKVIITTRNSFLKIGDDIQTNELDKINTKQFLLEVLEVEHNYTKLSLETIEQELNKNEAYKVVHKLTLGKPIEIIRFANSFIQKGKLSEDFLKDMNKINSRSERNEFFYGRNYEQLKGDKDAQDIFVTIGLLTPQDTLTSLINHIKFILNKKDEDEQKFNASIDKLVKLRLIEIDNDGSYKVDTKDILDIMKKEYEKRDSGFKSGTRAFYERIKSNITIDTDRALLNHVKSLRHQSSAETTIQQYREILRQGKEFSSAVKLEALFDLSDFLFNNRGEKEKAIKVFDDYFDTFYEFDVLKRYASYCWTINKEKTIKILEDFYSNHTAKGLNLTKTQKFHILALIVMRESQYWSDKFEREYQNKTKILQELNRIFKNFGHFLFSFTKKYDIYKDLSSEERKDLIDALELFVDICYRIDNKPFAENVCKYALANFSDRDNIKFKKKLEKLQGYRHYSKPSSPTHLSEFGEKLKVATGHLPIINLAPKENGYTGRILNKYVDIKNSKSGYISVNGFEGRVYFKDYSLKGITFDTLKENSEVKFGFGKINQHKFGAINITIIDK